MTPRQLDVHRAVLIAAENVYPYQILDETLRADASRKITPRAHVSELDAQLLHAERQRHLIGIYSDAGTKWKLSDAGRAWLAEYP